MAITRTQIAKQLLANGGRIGLRFGNKGPGQSSREARDARDRGMGMGGKQRSGPSTPSGVGGNRDGRDPTAQFTPESQKIARQLRNQTMGAGDKFIPDIFPITKGLANFFQVSKPTPFDIQRKGLIKALGPQTINMTGADRSGDTPLWAQLGYSSEEEYLAALARTQAPAPSIMEQGTTTEEDDDGLKLRFRAEGGPIGGEYDFESARQMYGLGKLVKKVTRTVKKIAKSPIGKAALLYTGAGGLGNLAAGQSFFSNFARPGFLGNVGSIFSKGGLENIMAKARLGKFVTSYGDQAPVFEKNILGKALTSPFGLITAASALAGLLTPEQEEEAQQLARGEGIDIEEARRSILNAGTSKDQRALAFRAEGGRIGYDEAGAVMSKEEMEKLAKSPLYKGFKKMYNVDPQMAKGNESYKDKFSTFEQLIKKGYQKGGDVEPVAKKTMPLLDMGGKEMDLREEGGFVPIGRMEKADDVPARLSKNEFVFTADAVRNAGDGDVDKGAEVMYNMMKNLESGGDVSEESQGLEGARKMFQTSQRLEEVL